MTIPSKDRGDLIREHGERIATLNERIDNIRRDVDLLKQSLELRTARRWSLNLALLGLFGAVIAAVIGGLISKFLPGFPGK